MEDIKKTEIAIQPDKATGVTSRAHGANLDAVGFNIDLLSAKLPTKAAEILDLYSELKDITADTPAQPDEDFDLAAERIKKHLEG